METTAALTRSVAETSAVRRETLTAVVALARAAGAAGAVGTLACAADRLTRSSGASLRPHPRASVAATRARLARIGGRMSRLLVIGEGVRGIGGSDGVQALRRRGGAGLLVVAPLEQAGHVVGRSSSEGNVHHGPDQHPDHVMQEAIGLHVIAHAA